jgi:hypothetical protein
VRTALLLAFVLPCSVASAQVKDEYDRFEGSRKLTYESQAKVELGQPQPSLHVVVKDGKETIFLRFIVASASDRRAASSWKYLRCNDIDWLIDGAPVELGDVVHDGQAVRGGVIEILLQPATREQLQKIGSGQVVEYRICNDEYRLSAADVAGVQGIYQKLAAGPAPATPAAAESPAETIPAQTDSSH